MTSIRPHRRGLCARSAPGLSPALALLASVLVVLAGADAAFAVEPNTAWAWGDNYYGQLGADVPYDVHGNRRTSIPVRVLDAGGQGRLTGVAAIAAGGQHTLALKDDGTVWAWGDNSNGQLGDGTTTTSGWPLEVKGPGGTGHLANIQAISGGGYHSVALAEDRTVWTWGRNSSGQLGDGTTVGTTTPVQVVGPGGTGVLEDIVAVQAGAYHTLAVRSDGTVWAWGENGNGQLGDSTTIDKSSPVQVLGPSGVGFLESVSAVAAGEAHSLAFKTDRTVWAWGYNNYGQLGDDTTTQRRTPVQVLGTGGTGFLTECTAVSAGQHHSMAIKDDRTLWAWGNNDFGQLGDNTTADRRTPVQVVASSGAYSKLTDVVAVAAGGGYHYSLGDHAHTLALTGDGTVWAWGDNSCGQLGDRTTTSHPRPVQVERYYYPYYHHPLAFTVGISAGYYHSLAVQQWTDRTLYVDASAAPGGTGSAEEPFQHVQEGIDAANDGDTVIVRPGTYVECIGFFGKAITVCGTDPLDPMVVTSTVIDADGMGPVVGFASGELSDSVIEGFTITGGLWTQNQAGGGGVYCYQTSPTIRHNLIVGNQAMGSLFGCYGGGIGCVQAWPTIEDNVIVANEARQYGGGICSYCPEPHPWTFMQFYRISHPVVVRRTIISGNSAGGCGGGIGYIGGAWFEIEDCEITDNTVGGSTPGVFSGPFGGGIGGHATPNTQWEEPMLTITGSAISYNVVSGGGTASAGGGGISCGGNCILLVEDCDVVGNQATEAKTSSQASAGGISCGGPSIIIRGCRVEGNMADNRPGISCIGQAVLIEDCLITGNVGTDGPGGGITCFRLYSGSSVTIRGNIIRDNRCDHVTGVAWGGGGGIWSSLCSLTVENNLIVNNDAGSLSGGGVHFAASSDAPGLSLVFRNNTVVGNSADGGAGGLRIQQTSDTPGDMIVSNNIFRDNTAPGNGSQIFCYTGTYPPPLMSYCNVEMGTDNVWGVDWGPGNFDLDPLFAEPENGDYHLKSRVGRWDPAALGGYGAWVTDDVTSPCINMGDPADDCSAELPPNGGRINIGCYGNTPEASKGLPSIDVAAETDFDWCYLNAPVTTEGRHKVTLTCSVADDPNGNSSYSVSVQAQPQDDGAVVLEPTADPWVWLVRAGTSETGPVGVCVVVEGQDVGGLGMAEAAMTIRPIGDITGDGNINAVDKAHMNAWLNGIPLPGDTVRHLDLNGDGEVNAVDKVQINRQLNGLGIL